MNRVDGAALRRLFEARTVRLGGEGRPGGGVLFRAFASAASKNEVIR
jgi:hypothetical protein